MSVALRDSRGPDSGMIVVTQMYSHIAGRRPHDLLWSRTRLVFIVWMMYLFFSPTKRAAGYVFLSIAACSWNGFSWAGSNQCVKIFFIYKRGAVLKRFIKLHILHSTWLATYFRLFSTSCTLCHTFFSNLDCVAQSPDDRCNQAAYSLLVSALTPSDLF
jgi:hypothetical protein